jgi:hypothetical protein
MIHSWLVFVLGLVPAADLDAEWPDFRGPTGQGHAAVSGLPVEWSATKNVAWKQAVPGLGWSSPVVAAGKVIVTSAVPAAADSKDLSLRVLCYDAATGKYV